MYLTNFDEFYAASEQLFRASPSKTRFLTKYSRKAGLCTLKVTDDSTCLKFRAERSSDLRKLERLNRLMLSMMCNGPEAADEINQLEEQAAEQTQSPASDVSTQQAQAQQQQQQQQQVSSSSGGRRRGGKKKK